jgi:hypothetical protein
MGNVYLTNGSQADVQAACSAPPDDGTITVVIPNGTYSWAGNLTITNSQGETVMKGTGVRFGLTFASTLKSDDRSRVHVRRSAAVKNLSKSLQHRCWRLTPRSQRVLARFSLSVFIPPLRGPVCRAAL